MTARKIAFFIILFATMGLVLVLLLFQFLLRPRLAELRTSAMATASVAAVVTTTWNGLQIEILAVNLNGWPLLQAYNQFNDPPLSGRRMMLINIKLTNVSGPAGEYIPVTATDFQVIGSHNTAYSTYAEETRCGVVPDALDGILPQNTWMSGNVCVQVPTDERDFKLIYEPYGGDQPALYFDLPEK